MKQPFLDRTHEEREGWEWRVKHEILQLRDTLLRDAKMEQSALGGTTGVGGSCILEETTVCLGTRKIPRVDRPLPQTERMAMPWLALAPGAGVGGTPPSA